MLTTEAEMKIEEMTEDLLNNMQKIELRNNAIREMNLKLTDLQVENKLLQDRVLSASKQALPKSNPYMDAPTVAEVAALKVENTGYRQEVIGLKHKMELMQKTMTNFDRLQSENVELKQKADNLGKQLIGHLTNTSSSSIDLERMKLENSLLKQNFDTLKAQLIEATDKITDLEAFYQTEQDRLNTALTKITREHLATGESATNFKRHIGVVEQQRNSLEEQLRNTQSELDETTVKLDKVRNELIEQLGKIGTKDIEIEHLRDELSSLKMSLESALSQKSGEAEDEMRGLRSEINRIRESNLEKNIRYETAETQYQLDIQRLREDNLKGKMRIDSLEAQEDINKEYKMEMENEISELRKENEAVLLRNGEMLSELTTQLANTSRILADNDDLRLQLTQMREAGELMEKQLEEAQSIVPRFKHEANMLSMENTGMKQELARVTNMLDRMTGKGNPEVQNNPKYSAMGFKMLEDQIMLLSNENQRLKDERAEGVIDGERLRISESRNKDYREEITMLKDRNLYIETELKKELREHSNTGNSNDEMLMKLREEIRMLKEKESRRAPAPMRIVNPVQSPVLEHYTPQRSATMSKSTSHSEKMLKDRVMMEVKVAKLERELVEKALRIEYLEVKLNETTEDLAHLKPFGALGIQPPHLTSYPSHDNVEGMTPRSFAVEETSKVENIRLRDRIRILEDRERQFIDEELEKDNLIASLQDKLVQAKEHNNNLSMGLE